MHHFPTLLILFVFIFSGQVSAQRLSYGLELDPSYHLRDDGDFNFAVGGFVSLDVSDRFVVSSGLKIGFQHLSDEIDLVFASNVDPTTGSPVSNSSFEVEHNATYLGLPLQARYKLSDKANHFYMNYNFTFWLQLSENSSETLNESGQITIDQRPIPSIYDTHGISTALGFGYEFSLKERFSVYLEPRVGVSYFLEDDDISPFSPFITYDDRQTDLGLTVGVRFK